MKKSSTSIVFEAVCDLHSMEQIVTRETLAEHTALKLTVIDDRIAILVDDGLVNRVQRGVFVPAPQHPPARPISKTILPGGMVKIEIGDDVLTLTPRESRALGELQAGAAFQYAAVESGHQMAVIASEFAAQLKSLQRQVAALRTDSEEGAPSDA